MNFPRGSIADGRGLGAGFERSVDEEVQRAIGLDAIADELIGCVIGHVDEAAGGIGSHRGGLDSGLVGAALGRGQRSAGTHGEAEDPAWIGGAGGGASGIVSRLVVDGDIHGAVVGQGRDAGRNKVVGGESGDGQRLLGEPRSRWCRKTANRP